MSPTYEYRVLCADGEHRWGAALKPGSVKKHAASSALRADSRGGCSCGERGPDTRPHPGHYVEHRAVGVWKIAEIRA